MLCLEFRELIFDLYIERIYGFSLIIIVILFVLKIGLVFRLCQFNINVLF